MNRQIKSLGLLLGTALLCISAIDGQSKRTLEGRVLDSSGAPIPNALVTSFTDDRVWTTKKDRDGSFMFADWTGKIRYIEASSQGFFIESVPITNETPAPVVFKLEVGWSSQCEPLSIGGVLAPPSYEERSGTAQLTGSVTLSGVPLANTPVALLREDLDAPITSGYGFNSMMHRFFKEAVAAETNSTEKGEFTFAGLDPGLYRVIAVHGSTRMIRTFWIARENLTKLPPIDLAPPTEGFTQACPL